MVDYLPSTFDKIDCITQGMCASFRVDKTQSLSCFGMVPLLYLFYVKFMICYFMFFNFPGMF